MRGWCSQCWSRWAPEATGSFPGGMVFVCAPFGLSNRDFRVPVFEFHREAQGFT